MNRCLKVIVGLYALTAVSAASVLLWHEGGSYYAGIFVDAITYSWGQ